MVNLGDKVRCKVTGYTGICVARTDYISGCTRISVQAPMKDDKVPEWVSLDEPMVEVLEAVIPQKKTDRGGPDLPIARPRDVAQR